MLRALLIGLLFFFLPVTAYAQTQECTIIYGGGELECTKEQQLSPTPVPQQQTVQNNTTKGGLPVEKAPQATATPATGPETLSLIALLPAAAAGMWLRRKV